MMAVIFALLALIPGILTTPFVVIYGLSSFFTELGPNATVMMLLPEIKGKSSGRASRRDGSG